MNRKFKIYITLSLIYTRDFWFCLKHYAWLESSKFSIVWHQHIMVTRYQPRAMSFILTWHNLITLTSDCLVPSELSSWAGQLLADLGHVKATVENPRDILEKMSPEEEALTLPRTTVSAPEALSWGTVILLCPKDFQQILRLPKSWVSLANKASPHTAPQ